MKKNAAPLFAILLACAPAFAQRPENPVLLMAEPAPELDYVAVANGLNGLPAGVKMGAPAAVQFNAQGNLLLLNRGPQPLMEFDPSGKFIRWFGEPMTRAHGLRIDSDGNIWITDVGAHIVQKLDPQGTVLMTLGTKGKAGIWDEAAGSRLFTEPTDLAFGRNGDFFVVQGHTVGTEYSYVLKFDKTGKFIKKWGGKGTKPSNLEVAHGIASDAKGDLWVADREHQRIAIFDQDGAFIREMHYAGLPSSIYIGPEISTVNGALPPHIIPPVIYMVNGFTGQVVKLDLNGNVLAATGRPGKGIGLFGEAHFITMSPKGEIYVADTSAAALQKFVKKTAEN